MNRPTLLQFTLLLFLFSGCSSVSERVEEAETLSMEHGFQKSVIKTKDFLLTTYIRFQQEGLPVSIYIEGDGYAYAGRHRVSSNPTPKNPIGLKLALVDTTPNVIYIARPCQYIQLKDDPNCHQDYWTTKRYSIEVMDATNEAINTLKNKLGFKKIRLIGYSGGGTVAAILATKRNDVIDLRTVAGNMDIDAFVRVHEVTPLVGSLNPVDFANTLVNIPQIHFVGEKDDIITPPITYSYIDAIREYDASLECVNVRQIKDVSHAKGWETMWQRYADEVVGCKR